LKKTTAIGIALALLAACSQNPKPAPAPVPQPSPPQKPPEALPARPAVPGLVPLPALVEPGSGDGFTVASDIVIMLGSQRTALQVPAARQLAEMIRRATGTTPRIVTSPPEPLPQRSFIALSLLGKEAPVDLGLGPEGYDLIIRSE